MHVVIFIIVYVRFNSRTRIYILDIGSGYMNINTFMRSRPVFIGRKILNNVSG